MNEVSSSKYFEVSTYYNNFVHCLTAFYVFSFLAPKQTTAYQSTDGICFPYPDRSKTRSKGSTSHEEKGNLFFTFSALKIIYSVFLSTAVADAVTKGKLPGIQYRTRGDVVKNLPRLGQGISVFVCYAPDPESPYYDPKDRQGVISRNQIFITHLIRDLERLGFTVISDLHLGETQPRNWLQWYVSRMELCDYLIMVCSPAFKELFLCETPKYRIIDQRASWFLTYQNVMQAEIVKEITESSASSKFLPVILDERYLPEDSVPSLFRLAPLYQLGSHGNRQFNYDNMFGDYEKLVCRMAGIDRMKMESPVDEGVIRVAPPFSQGQG